MVEDFFLFVSVVLDGQVGVKFAWVEVTKLCIGNEFCGWINSSINI